MPITAPSLTAAIISAGPALTGPVWLQLAGAIGVAVAGWSVNPSNVVVMGTVVGALGGGTVTGKIFMAPVPLPLSAAAGSAGLVGPLSPQMATAVGVGIANALNASAGYQGVSTGAIGADLSKIVAANPATLIAALVQSFYAFQIRGPTAGTLAVGLGSGIATMFLTGTGTGVAVGGAGPSPGVGVSKSSLI